MFGLHQALRVVLLSPVCCLLGFACGFAQMLYMSLSTLYCPKMTRSPIMYSSQVSLGTVSMLAVDAFNYLKNWDFCIRS